MRNCRMKRSQKRRKSLRESMYGNKEEGINSSEPGREEKREEKI